MTKQALNALFILFLLPLSTTSWDYMLGGFDWEEQCKEDSQAPIDISGPFTYAPAQLSFYYNKMLNTFNLYNDGNNLILEGDFGYIKYDNEIYTSTQMFIFSPSQHTISNHRFPLEFQIIHKNPEGTKNIAISILHKQTEFQASTLLDKIGFEDEETKIMKPMKGKLINKPIDLNKYLSEDKNFFFYEGKEFFPPCKSSTLYFILTDVLDVAERQMKNFPEMILNNNKIIQHREGREIFLTCPMEQLTQKIELAHKIINNNIRKENQLNMIKINKAIDELNLDPKVLEQFMEKFKMKEEEEENDSTSNLSIDTTLTITGKQAIVDKSLNSDLEEKEKIDRQLEILKNIQEIKSDIIVEKAENASEANDIMKGEEEVVEKIPFEIVKDKAMSTIAGTQMIDYSILGDEKEDNSIVRIDKKFPKTKQFFDTYTLNKLNEKYNQVLLQVRKNRYKNSPITMLQLRAAKKILKNHNYNNKCFLQVDYANENELSEIGSKIEEITKKVDKQQEIHSQENMRKIFADEFGKAINKTCENCNKEKEEEEQSEEMKELKKIEAKLDEISKRLDEHEQRFSEQNERRIISQEITKALNNSECCCKNNLRCDECPLQKKEKKGMKPNQIRFHKKKEIKEPTEIEKKTNTLLHPIKPKEEDEKFKIKKKYFEKKKKHIDNLIMKNQQKLDNFKRECNCNCDDKLNVIFNGEIYNVKVNINLKSKQQKISNENQNFKKLKPYKEYKRKKSHKIKYNGDLKTSTLLDYVFNKIKDESVILDIRNNHNASHYNYTTVESKVKLSLNSLSAILSFVAQMPTELKLEEQKAILYNYTNHILHKQNLFYLDYYLNPLEIIDDEKLVEFIFILGELTKSKIKVKTKVDIDELVENIFDKYPIIPIDPTTEEKSTYINTRTGEGEIDYLAYYYMRYRYNKKMRKNLQNFGDRGEGKLATDLSDKLNKGEDKLIFRDIPLKCKNIIFSSPINIKPPFIAGEYFLKFNLDIRPRPISMIKDDYKLLANGFMGQFMYKDLYTYDIEHLEIHFPSEHTIGPEEKRSIMEIQLIGYNHESEKTAAIAILFEYGEENKLLSDLGLSEKNPIYAYKLKTYGGLGLYNGEVNDFNIKNVFPEGTDINRLHYYHYVGALTTPVCVEDVDWFVLQDKMTLSRVQAHYFPILFGAKNNVRRTQPINGRVIKIM